MTDQSKYARAIEAIRTKEDIFEVVQKCGVDLIQFLDDPIKYIKNQFDVWSYQVKENSGGGLAAELSVGQIEGVIFIGHACDPDFNPTPAKCLLVAMLMALEEMDKRGEA